MYRFPKRSIASMSILLAALLAASTILSAQTQKQSTSTPTGFEIRFFDSQTGFSLQPDAVEVKLGEDATALRPNGTGRFTLPRPVSRGVLNVSTHGYYTKSTQLFLTPTVTTIEIMMDPLQPPPELAPQAIAALRHANSATITGFVIDETSGEPLADVDVSTTSNVTVSKTNARGYFVLELPSTFDPSIDTEPATTTFVITKQGYRDQDRARILLFPNTVSTFRIRLRPGSGKDVIGETQNRGHVAAVFDSTNTPVGGLVSPRAQEYSPLQLQPGAYNAAAPTSLPSTIRVGRNCTGRSCSLVVVLSLDTYCKLVLPAEWYAGWHANSLKAGAVAIRSYAVSFVNNPISTDYDICDTISCQKLGDSTNSNTDAAVDATSGAVLVDGNNSVVRSEYAAENNNSTCGDCSTGAAGACFSDVVCCGAPNNGHGRGMCQNGSQRWAAGTKYTGGNNLFGPQD